MTAGEEFTRDGELALAGEGLKAASATATGAGEAALTVRAAGNAKKHLRRKGKSD